MKIEHYPLHLFEDKEIKQVYEITVPLGAVLLDAKVLHDGIYVWFTIPELETHETKIERFIIYRKGINLPDEAVFLTILDTIIESQKGQGILIFPIFKI
jgi:hypothetical protein